METKIPYGFEEISQKLRTSHNIIKEKLNQYGYHVDNYPQTPRLDRLEGEGAAVAYPIQGILKYHGLADWDARTAFFSSISLNNDAAKSVTYVSFDPELDDDIAIKDGGKVGGRDLERVQQTLDFVRKSVGADTKARVVTRNIIRANKVGKGLGTSASGSAALALAAIEAALGSDYSSNMRYVTCVSRYLAGSGCRSAAGGVSLWLSYPGIPHEQSFALRLDTRNEFDDISLITVPVDSRIGLKTEDAHKDAPNSPLFKEWLLSREKYLLEAINAVKKRDWETIGNMAEKDTFILHGITSSGGDKYKIVAFEPETIELLRAANIMRRDGVPVYYSVDTGPTPVFITHDDYADDVMTYLSKIGFDDAVKGKIAGPAEVLKRKQAEEYLGDL